MATKMNLTMEQKGFGISVKCGKQLVAEIYNKVKTTPYRVIVFEECYKSTLAKHSSIEVYEVTNSHSKKTNWVGKVANTDALVNALSKLEFKHTPGQSTKKTKKTKKTTKAPAAKKH